MALQRPVFQPFKRPNDITHIFLGIDFGTSFTKISYSTAPSNNVQIKTLKWEGSDYEDGFVIPTILYVKDNKLYFEKPDGDSLEIKYFKYSMLAESLINNHQNTKNVFEEMCCVYFLAQVIKRSLKKIQQEIDVASLNGIKISVNMGAPLENFYEEKGKQNTDLYKEILENAITLAGGSKVHSELSDNCVLLDNLDSVYTEILHKKAFLNWNAEVVPELAAELFLYQQSKNIPEGLYAIIDVGGGTVDMAIFEKYKLNTMGMYCLDETVLPYGVEILDKIKSDDIRQTFMQAFTEMIMNAKKETDLILADIPKVDVFFLGGGATNEWYKKCIVDTQAWLQNSFKPKLNFKLEINDFIENEDYLIIKNQRLLISQMIARSKDDFPSVLGFPISEEQARKGRLISHEAITSLEDDLYERSQKYRD